MTQAFILGAGLGTRLQPLTRVLPKPLVPLFHQPLAAWALEACARVGITRFAINTHHLPEAWNSFGEAMPSNPAWQGANQVVSQNRRWNGHELTLFHEPVLLETGGGLKNIAPWMLDQALLIHNGDIFSTLPLEDLIAAHKASGLPATLALRSHGEARHIALDPSLTRVTDIRGRLGRADGSHVFTGIYCVNPGFLSSLPANPVVSVIPAFLDLAAHQQLGAVVLDDGDWLDLGDRDAYLRAHRDLHLGPAIHPDATVATGAIIHNSVIGPGATVAAGTTVRDSVLWPGSQIAPSAVLDRCIVYSNKVVTARHSDADL